MESHGHETRIAECIRSRATAVAAAEIAGDALVTENQDRVAVAAAKAISIAVMIPVTIPVAPTVAVTILILWRTILLLWSGQRSQCDR
jgi:hypothetical protein